MSVIRTEVTINAVRLIKQVSAAANVAFAAVGESVREGLRRFCKDYNIIFPVIFTLPPSLSNSLSLSTSAFIMYAH